MKKLNHPDRLSARKELVDNGFVPAHNSPGRPELWAKHKDKRRFAIGRETRARSEAWHIVDYPEPAVCDPEQACELAKRDGIVLNAGVMPVTAELPIPELTEDETSWLE